MRIYRLEGVRGICLRQGDGRRVAWTTAGSPLWDTLMCVILGIHE